MKLEIKNLKESNTFLNTVLDSITSAIFIVDRDITIQSFNDSFGALFGRTEDKILGELCGNAIGCKYTVNEGKNCGTTSNCTDCELRKSLLRAFTEKVPTYKGKLTREFYINGIPTLKYFLYTTEYITYNNEEMILIIVDNVTELEMQKIKLEDLNKLKNEFLGMAAHDLRNPIGIIKMFSSFMLDFDNKNLSTDQLDLIKKINQNSDFMLQLLEELLDISKIESGKLELNMVQDDYVEFADSIVEINKVFAHKKGISIIFKCENIPLIHFDKNKMEQVLNNLINNAIKYSFQNTIITVEILEEGDLIVTKVIDQGQGIPQKELPLIFKAFHKTSVKSTGGEKSTGLGLAISKRIIEGHNGCIEVESKVGKGSTFCFKLPIIYEAQKK